MQMRVSLLTCRLTFSRLQIAVYLDVSAAPSRAKQISPKAIHNPDRQSWFMSLNPISNPRIIHTYHDDVSETMTAIIAATQRRGSVYVRNILPMPSLHHINRASRLN